MKIPFDKYSAIDAVNWSTLKELRRSPLHYRHRLDNPRADSSRLALGRAAHTAVFEPDRFMLEYACFKGPIRRGKKWDAFKEQHRDETILKVDEYQTCLAMRDAVRKNPWAATYLENGLPEHSIQWTDPETQLPCKARLDWWNEDRAVLVDLKTTNDVGADRFAATCARMAYHCQLAFYADGLRALIEKAVSTIIVAVEAQPPHDVAVYRLDEDAIYAGWEEVQGLLWKAKECRQSKRWPGRYQEEQVLRLPRWTFNDDDETDATGLDLEWSPATNNGG